MTTYQAPRARSTRAASKSAAIRACMAEIHTRLERIIVDPSDHANYERLDSLIYTVWEWCQVTGEQPWGWCLDRYCGCKIALAEQEPDPLPGADEWVGLA